MPREWSLTVEGFGRIERAEVTVKPLTVLVGPNNSGKSYLGALIWGIESGGLNALGQSVPVLDTLIEQWLSRAQRSESYWEPWSDDERHTLIEQWPDYVRAVTPRFCRLLFDVKDLQPRRLEIGATGLDETWYAAVEQPPMAIARESMAPADEPRLRWFRFANGSSLPPLGQDRRPTYGRRQAGIREWGTSGHEHEVPRTGSVLAYMLGFTRRLMLSDYMDGAPVFLPAARTGFSLFLPAFLQLRLGGTLAEWSASEGHPSLGPGDATRGSARFTRPQVHLMSGLISAFGGQRGPYADEADRLERECLDGTIVVRAETGVARYAFRPDGASEDLGLQLSSALVTELMPLVVLLRYAQDLPFLVIEEPEAHLHPRLQRLVTRCLCRLVRRGVRVLVTTHSANVAQQINNLVKLGSLDTERRAELQQRFQYGSDERLDGDDVAVHEFRFTSEGRTIVERMEQTPWGFPLPTFNEELHLLTSETLALNAELEPEADR